MNQYLLLNRIRVQNANAVSGFTWGFPAITHFLGFTHNLQHKLKKNEKFKNFNLQGCAVIAHKHQVHSYQTSGGINFSQIKNPHYIKVEFNKGRIKDPSVIEEAKMNMTVSLLIDLEAYVGNRQTAFEEWVGKACHLQRLAGGTILDIQSVNVISIDESNLRELRRKLLPGFVLQDRSEYLASHFKNLQRQNPETELLDAWLDFASLKKKARPKNDLMERHLQGFCEKNPENQEVEQLLTDWYAHKESPYEPEDIPNSLKSYFDSLESNKKANTKLLEKWKNYCNPNEKTEADWEYLKKPESGYLVPIMTGYKAISEVYKNKDISGTRDDKTDVCFVEAVHAIGEWQSVHRIKTTEELAHSLWHYAPYEKHWYLCKQGLQKGESNVTKETSTSDFD